MNFWTGLILGIIIGWVVEWIIDWLFWRRDAAAVHEVALSEQERLVATGELAALSETDYEARLAEAELEYQTRLRAVEEDWQARLNLNEQQWQAHYRTLEEDNAALRAPLGDAPAGAILAAGAVGLGALLDEETTTEDAVLADEALVTELAEEEVDWSLTTYDEAWPADVAFEGEDTLVLVEGMDSDVAERLRLAGIDSVDALAAADPTTLAVTTGLEPQAAEAWIARAAALTLTGAAISSPAATRHDDLTRVHGIGPRYAALLTAAGIVSFDDLAAATPEQLRDVIKPSPMQQINFASWSAQAAALAGARGLQAGDDLTELEGIGPVYAAKLRERGIVSFADLAAADETTLAGIIDAPAWRRINYGDWIAQARLAAAGDQSGLEELQGQLFRRGGDNLGLIRGMGGRSAAALSAAGIATYAALSEATPQQIESALREAGVRGSYDYEAWISEAGVRAAGKRVSSGRHRAAYTVPCPQDLSAVPGIGPIFEERLYAAGIGSYWTLAELPTDQLATVLDGRLSPDELEEIKAAAMSRAVETNSLGRAWNGSPPDDFDGLPGIGEVYERRLYEAGICTYDTLAATAPGRLAEICQAPPMRTPDYAQWVNIAADLAAARRSS
jgi:predicted flap endonuclease-1-like 5' DNA nuclease